MKRGISLRKPLVILTLLFSLNATGTYIFHKYACHQFDQKAPCHAQAAVVFFSGMTNNHHLSQETIRRLNQAVFLMRQGYAENILCVGGNRPSWPVSGAEIMRRWLMHTGLPAGKIFAGPGSFDTMTNIQAATEVARNRGWNSLCLVSSPVHLLRIRHLLQEKSGLHVCYSPYLQSSVCPPKDMWEIAIQVHHEWMAWTAILVLPTNAYLWLMDRLRR